jgi:hypothetical protein
MSPEQQRELVEARGKLKATLIKMGLAQHIEWDELDGTD